MAIRKVRNLKNHENSVQKTIEVKGEGAFIPPEIPVEQVETESNVDTHADVDTDTDTHTEDTDAE